MIFIKKWYKYIIQIYLSLISFIILSILLNNNCTNIYNYLFNSSIDFQYIKSKTKYLIGNLINDKYYYVSSNKWIIKDIKKVDNSYYLYMDNNYVITNQVSGIVVFIGNKDNLGSTVIIYSDNGEYYWYSHIENISVNLYDYIKENTIIGSIISNYLILTITKDNEYLNYEDYF